MTEGSVIELRNLRQYIDIKPDDWFDQLIRTFFDTQLIIDKGAAQNVSTGDYFMVVESENKVITLTGEEIGTIQEEGCLIKAVSVYPKFSVCKLESYKYEKHIDLLSMRLQQLTREDGTIDLANHLAELNPVTIGQKVILVDKQEKAMRDSIEELYGKSLGKDVGMEEKAVLHSAMIRKADAFLETHGNGYFAPAALFHKGYAQFHIGAYKDAINTFTLFVDNYPFNVSADGASSWIAEASTEINKQRLEVPPETEKKSRQQRFDVFLCHNSADKPAIREINWALKAAGIVTWLDEEQLAPGKSWRPALEKQITKIKKVCVFIGGKGVGPWQEIEINAILEEFIRRKADVIPVILATSSKKPLMPLFLKQMTWIDLRENYEQNLLKLIYAMKEK